MKSYSQMKRSALPVRSPLTREKGQQNQESRQPAQRDKSTKSVQETVINKTVSNQSSKGVNIIQGKTYFYTFRLKVTSDKVTNTLFKVTNNPYIIIIYYNI